MQQESNWPLLTVSKSLFDAMAASKGSKGAAAAAAAAMEVEDAEGAVGGEGAWGDDAELELEEDGTIKAGGEEDEEVGEDGEGGWDVDEEDLELPPELLDTAGAGAGAAAGQDTGMK